MLYCNSFIYSIVLIKSLLSFLECELLSFNSFIKETKEEYEFFFSFFSELSLFVIVFFPLSFWSAVLLLIILLIIKLLFLFILNI